MSVCPWNCAGCNRDQTVLNQTLPLADTFLKNEQNEILTWKTMVADRTMPMITVKLPNKNQNCENLPLWATCNTSTRGPFLWAVCCYVKMAQHWGGRIRKRDPHRVVSPCSPNGQWLTLQKSVKNPLKVHTDRVLNCFTTKKCCLECNFIISFELMKTLTCQVSVHFKEQHPQLSTASTEPSSCLLL